MDYFPLLGSGNITHHLNVLCEDGIIIKRSGLLNKKEKIYFHKQNKPKHKWYFYNFLPEIQWKIIHHLIHHPGATRQDLIGVFPEKKPPALYYVIKKLIKYDIIIQSSSVGKPLSINEEFTKILDSHFQNAIKSRIFENIKKLLLE